MRFLLETVCLLTCLGLVVSTPSWTCRVCEDVVQTWHDHYRCAGEFDYPEGAAELTNCRGPQLDCDMLPSPLKTSCGQMRDEFQNEPMKARMLWEAMMMNGKVYKTCTTLGKCRPDSGGQYTPCHNAFSNDPECETNIQCASAVRACEDSCYLCVLLIRDWPLFQEICKPTGATMPNAVPENGGGYVQAPAKTNSAPATGSTAPRTFLEMQSKTQTRTRTHLRDHLRSNSAQNTLQPSTTSAKTTSTHPDTNEGQQHALTTGFTLPQTCMAMWNEIRESKKARYFVSWLKSVFVLPNLRDRLDGNLWDANTVCKCLGKCELSRFEELGLMEQCRYDEDTQALMDLAFQDELGQNTDELEVPNLNLIPQPPAAPPRAQDPNSPPDNNGAAPPEDGP